jgi:enoyl-CoA hydratase
VLNDAEPPLFEIDPASGRLVRRERAVERIARGREGLRFWQSRVLELLGEFPRQAAQEARTIRYYRDLYAPDAEGWRIARESLSELGRRCRERATPAALLIFPMLHELDDDYPYADLHAEIRARDSRRLRRDRLVQRPLGAPGRAVVGASDRSAPERARARDRGAPRLRMDRDADFAAQRRRWRCSDVIHIDCSIQRAPRGATRGDCVPYRPVPELVIERRGPVAIVTMNNPEMRNAFNDNLHEGMREIWEHLADDASVRSIVLTGAGKAFSAGGNIPGFIRDYENPEFRRRSLRHARRLLEAMLECPKPMIAAVNGPAVGLGCSVAVSCDIVYIAESTFMADTHVSIGLVAGDGGAASWPLMMSILKAKYYLLTGDRIPAKDCVELGLANFAVPDAELMPRAIELAERLAKQPKQALEETKRALGLHLQRAALAVAPFALAAEGESFATEDIKNTVDTFKKKL